MSELRPGLAPSQALQDALKGQEKGHTVAQLHKAARHQRASRKRMGCDVIKTNLMESEIQMRMVNSTKPFNALNVRN